MTPPPAERVRWRRPNPPRPRTDPVPGACAKRPSLGRTRKRWPGAVKFILYTNTISYIAIKQNGMSAPQSSRSHLVWPLSRPSTAGPYRCPATAFTVGIPLLEAPALPSPDPSPGARAGKGRGKGTVHDEHQPSSRPPPVLTWLRDLPGSAPRYNSVQTFHQPLPEPSMASPPPPPAPVHRPASMCWLRGPTTNVAGIGYRQAQAQGRGAHP